jgi:hypothetical protein
LADRAAFGVPLYFQKSERQQEGDNPGPGLFFGFPVRVYGSFIPRNIPAWRFTPARPNQRSTAAIPVAGLRQLWMKTENRPRKALLIRFLEESSRMIERWSGRTDNNAAIRQPAAPANPRREDANRSWL